VPRPNNTNNKPKATPAVKRQAAPVKASALDAFVNSITRQGYGMPNPENGTAYPINRITQDYQLLISLYRNNWMVNKIIDLVAEDMTKAWINITSDMTPEMQDDFDRVERKTHVRAKITKGTKWGRLFGGAAALMMIDGMSDEDLAKPLNLDAIMPGSFRGLMVVDRWSGVYPQIDLIGDISDPEFGEPDTYEMSDFARTKTFKVHHSHLLRFPGRPLPAWEEMSTQMWGASEIEAAFEEIKKRDNASANLAGLIFRANINIQKMDGVGQMLALGDVQTQNDIYTALTAQNQLMNNFSTYVTDTNDSFETIQNTTFAGLNEIYESFMLDVCGATGIPMTKLFGRSPAGMDASGEGDLQNYYDMIADKQEAYLRPVLEKLLPVMFMSEFGKVPDDINFRFNSPRTPSEQDIADLVDKKAHTIYDGFTAGLFSQQIALKELQAMGQTTGVFTNITDEDIEKADNDVDLGDIGGMMQKTTSEGELQTAEKQSGSSSNEMSEEEYLKRSGHRRGTVGDAEWDENKHSRRSDGEFGIGGDKSKKSIDTEAQKRYANILLNCKTSDGVKIKRLIGHSVDRAEERNVSPEQIKDILQNNDVTYPGNKPHRTVYVKNGIRIVVDYADGSIVSVVKENDKNVK
jgi:phage-related protein (TIGR01555 family)